MIVSEVIADAIHPGCVDLVCYCQMQVADICRVLGIDGEDRIEDLHRAIKMGASMVVALDEGYSGAILKDGTLITILRNKGVTP